MYVDVKYVFKRIDNKGVILIQITSMYYINIFIRFKGRGEDGNGGFFGP